MSATDWFLLVVLSILWGGSFLFAKIAVDELPPLTLALGRVAIAAAILAALAHAGGASLAALVRGWRAFAVLGVLNCAIPFSLIFWGQTHIPSGLASILNATTPIFTVLIAQVATRDEKLTAGKLVGVGAGFLGVAAMLGPDLLIDIGAGVWAQLACLVARSPMRWPASTVAVSRLCRLWSWLRASSSPPPSCLPRWRRSSTGHGRFRHPRRLRSLRCWHWRCSRPRLPTSSTFAFSPAPARPICCW
jgi:drug/metabolite transporter (DMT)-like permease